MCQICILKEQGIENPEEHVLTSYQLSSDMNRIPIPLDDQGLEQGILMLYPEEMTEQQGMLPQSGGVVGTVKAIFRAFGFTKPKEEIIAEEPISKAVAKSKRGGGLYEPKR
jgi:hypothetical protein